MKKLNEIWCVFITEEETGFFFLTKKILTNFKSTHHNMHIQVGIAVLKWSAWMTRNLAFCNCLSGLQNTHSFFHLFCKHLYHEPFYSLRWDLSFPSRCLYSSKVEKPSATWTQVSEEGTEGSVRWYPLTENHEAAVLVWLISWCVDSSQDKPLKWQPLWVSSWTSSSACVPDLAYVPNTLTPDTMPRM